LSDAGWRGVAVALMDTNMVAVIVGGAITTYSIYKDSLLGLLIGGAIIAYGLGIDVTRWM
jgi:hypothetical protein